MSSPNGTCKEATLETHPLTSNQPPSCNSLQHRTLFRNGKPWLPDVLTTLTSATDSSKAMCHCSNMAAVLVEVGVKVESIDRGVAASACV
jgi:hypothetical protein